MIEQAGSAQPGFAWTVRVYWEDTDAGGVVYHSNYLNFFERARTEWLRSLGLEQRELEKTRGLLFAVRDLQIEFLKPARLDDLLKIEVSVLERRRASLLFSQRMTRIVDDMPLSLVRVRAACLQSGSFRPRPIPDDLFSGDMQ